MRIDDVLNASDKLDDQTRSSIAKLIDIKVESEMKEVLNALHNEFKLLDTKFQHVDTKFQHVESKFSNVYWVVGLSTAFLAILMTAISLFKH